MERYLNLGGDSNVIGYEIGPTYISVVFTNGSTYLYTYQSAGATHIEEMKRLARIGQGLNSYIMRNVRKLYASKH